MSEPPARPRNSHNPCASLRISALATAKAVIGTGEVLSLPVRYLLLILPVGVYSSCRRVRAGARTPIFQLPFRGKLKRHRPAPRSRERVLVLRACLSVRFQGFTPTPQYRPSASSRLWPARPAALCLPGPCGLGSDSHGGKVFSGKLLEFLTQTGS